MYFVGVFFAAAEYTNVASIFRGCASSMFRLQTGPKEEREKFGSDPLMALLSAEVAIGRQSLLFMSAALR